MLKKLLVSAALLLATPVLAQNVQYISPVTRNHIPVWNTNGVLADGGTSADSPISSIGITNNGGSGLCINTARQSTGNYEALCLGASSTGPATISLQNYGSAPSESLQFVVNGISYPFPGSLSQLIINTTPVVGGNNGSCLYVNGTTVGQQTCAASSITGLTGDGTATGPGLVPLTLATVNGNVGTFGSAAVVPIVTVNGKGLITAISNLSISIPGTQLTGTTLASNIVTSSLTAVGTISTGVWQGTLIGATYGGTGVNNGSSTLTLGAALTTTGTGTPTLAFPNTSPFTYTFQGSSDTIVGRATTDTLTNKTLTLPTINAGALSGTFTGTPAFSGANFITYANIAQAGAATIIGNSTASLANQSAFTIQGLSDISAPNATLDFIPIYNHTTGTIQRVTASELTTAVGSGVTSIAGNAGAFTLTNGITNTVNAIGLVIPVAPANGGTGAVSPTAHTVQIGEGTSAFASVGPGTTGQALVSNGAADPSFQSGGWVLLNTLTASTSATLSDTSSLTATYSEYEIVFANIIPASNSTTFELQVHESGTFPSTGYLSTGIGNNSGGVALFDNPTTFIPLSHTSLVTNSTPGLNGWVRVATPSASSFHNFHGHTGYATGSGAGVIDFDGYLNTSAVIDGFQVLFSAGNITSGTVKIYGRL